jgi:hypothetical protein
MFGQPLQRVLEDRQIGGVVLCKLGGPQAISSSSVETITRVTRSDCFAAAMLQAISG